CSAQPRLEVARPRMSCHPILAFGQPSARASGSHIAITCGDQTSDGFRAGTQSEETEWLRRRPQSEDAGVQSVARLRRDASVVSASPEVSEVPTTSISRRPPRRAVAPATVSRRLQEIPLGEPEPEPASGGDPELPVDLREVVLDRLR